MSVVITGIGPDFTKMESFGKVDEFAETLVSSWGCFNLVIMKSSVFVIILASQ